ncbi:MAG: M48 family metalloprotease [Pseudomonadota bacterium]
MGARRLTVFLLLGFQMLVLGCTAPQQPVELALPPVGPEVARAQTAADFRRVLARVEPVAESVCRDTSKNRNCNFAIQVNTSRSAPPNAYQTYTSTGRPLLIFNETLLANMRTSHEIALVIGHEAAHYIRDHSSRKQASAEATAREAATLAIAAGEPPEVVAQVLRVGAFVGLRRYSKAFELEADRLGAEIAFISGYDPVIGVQYFTRARDPGDQFLGTHPPNAQRIQAVRDVTKDLKRAPPSGV